MKYFLPLIFFIFTSAYGATCTTTSRTNYQTGQVLTSSALNADLNQLVTKVNSLDGGCVTDGTLEAAALNATDFAAVTNGIQQGCVLSFVDTNTVQVGKCILSVNGTFVRTTTTNNVTWGCTSCSAEVISTQYYVYAKTGSTGTTLNLLISSVAPGTDGYDASGNKVIGKFYNNSSSAIDVNSLYNWTGLEFRRSASVKNFSYEFGDSLGATCTINGQCGYADQFGDDVLSFTRVSTGNYTVVLKNTPTYGLKCIFDVVVAGALAGHAPPVHVATASSFTVLTRNSTGATLTDTAGTMQCEGY